jgi:hypothetical protein
MNRLLRLALIPLLVLLVAGGLFLALRPVPAKIPVAKVKTELGNPYTEHAAYYDISAAYPTTTPLSAAAGEVATDEMQTWIISSIGQFKTNTNAENPSAEDIQAMGFDQGRKVSLTITYTTVSSAHTTSYLFTEYEDTGGAHGNTTFKTFTYDLASGKGLALADLFVPNADYLTTLSQTARAKLPSILGGSADTVTIEAGTTPDPKNFENWYLDNASLAILFPPYAVAAYAAGPQTLSIPLSELASMLKPEYKP